MSTKIHSIPILKEIISFLLSTRSSQFKSYNNLNNINNDTIINNNNMNKYYHFWGPIDSSVDWCEHNYIISPYIAEFFNTTSAIPMTFWAILGILFAWKNGVKEIRFVITFLSLGCVGIGSACFHGTLRHWAQMLDELPMILNIYCTFFCALETYNKKLNKKILIVLIIGCILQAILYIIFEIYGIFFFSFCFIIIFQLISISKFCCRDNSPKIVKRIIIIVIILYVISGALWLSENIFCNYLRVFNFHALWHLGAGYGMYLYILLLTYMRGTFLKKQCEIKHSSVVQMHYVVWIDP